MPLVLCEFNFPQFDNMNSNLQLSAQMTPFNDSFEFKEHAIKFRFTCNSVAVFVYKQSNAVIIMLMTPPFDFMSTT